MNDSFDPYVIGITQKWDTIADSDLVCFDIRSDQGKLWANCKTCQAQSSRLGSADIKSWLRNHAEKPHLIKIYSFSCSACPSDVNSFTDYESEHLTKAQAFEAREMHLSSEYHRVNSEESDYFRMPPPDSDDELSVEYSTPQKQ